FDGAGHLGGETLEHRTVDVVERVAVDAVDFDGADHLAQAHQRYAQEAVHPPVGSRAPDHRVDPLVGVEVGGVQGAAFGDSPPGEARPQWDPQPGDLLVDGRIGCGDVQLTVLDQQDRAAAEVHQRPHGPEHGLHHALQLEPRADLACDVGEKGLQAEQAAQPLDALELLTADVLGHGVDDLTPPKLKFSPTGAKLDRSV